MTLPELARRAVSGGVDAIQIRERDLTDSELQSTIVGVLTAITGSSAQVIVNGRPGLAREMGISLHLPESANATERDSIQMMGRSVHSAAAARLAGDVDYLTAGHVFSSASKAGLEPIGLDGFWAIIEASDVPVIAIGGITADRVESVFAAGASGVAVISEINNSAEPEMAARRLRDAIEHAMGSK
jgi:thiamine-phosphate diphosphorylase